MQPEQQALVDSLVADLRRIPGVAAIALGGSCARGTQHAGSDIDLGLYYREDAPFAIDAICEVAARVHDAPNPVVTDFYGWGPWVNGGAWLTIGGQRVDFLYRNLDQLQRVIDDCRAGKVVLDYEQQPPYGFCSPIYLGELCICRPLFDPASVLTRLKAQVAEYPQALKAALIQRYLWGAEFALLHAEKSAGRGDTYMTVGCLTRIAAYLTQVILALNEVYPVTDKGALAEIDALALRPEGYAASLNSILACPGNTPEQLAATTLRSRQLLQQVIDLCQGWYTPGWRVPDPAN